MYMYNVMLAVMEGGCGGAFFICDGLVAAVADPHFKLKAHEWDGRTLGAALAAHGLPTLPAVVLSQPNFLTVPHLLEVPEERLVTLLAGITVQPLRGLGKKSTEQVTMRSGMDKGTIGTAYTSRSGQTHQKQLIPQAVPEVVTEGLLVVRP